LSRRPKADEEARDQKFPVVFDKASFSYSPEDPDPPLAMKNVTLKVKRGEVVMIVGVVGSGKSVRLRLLSHANGFLISTFSLPQTLVQAAINEVPIVSGSAPTYGTVSYVPQEAWIINATVRDNITFGRPYNEAFFKRVAKAACLLPDFAMMPAGDLTEIGERGANLSGGQKQRISIARVRLRLLIFSSSI